jgi:hypothetical protein
MNLKAATLRTARSASSACMTPFSNLHGAIKDCIGQPVRKSWIDRCLVAEIGINTRYEICASAPHTDHVDLRLGNFSRQLDELRRAIAGYFFAPAPLLQQRAQDLTGRECAGRALKAKALATIESVVAANLTRRMTEIKGERSRPRLPLWSRDRRQARVRTRV